VLGTAPDGEEISTAIGRFGPFVKHGKTYASLKPGDDAYTIELPRALELLREKAEAIANRIIASFDDGAIQVLNGKYGPYITDGTKNAKIPKDREPKSLTRDECAALLEAAPVRPARGGFRRGGARGAAAPKAAATKAPRARKAAAAADGNGAVATKTAPKRKPATRKAAPAKAAAKKAAPRKRAAKVAVEPAGPTG
jgi:DNA topoisomerase-1